MPRIHEGTQKRFGTAGKRGLRHQESKWAAYDAGLTTEMPVSVATGVLDDVPKRPLASSSRRGTKRKAISLKDDEFILSTVQTKPKSTFMISSEEMISTRLARPAAVSISLSQVEPIKLSEGKIPDCLLQHARAPQKLATAKTVPQHADTKPPATNHSLLPQPTAGDKVFDIGDVVDSQTTLDEWEQHSRLIISLSPGPKTVPNRHLEERVCRSPAIKRTFDVGKDDACVEEEISPSRKAVPDCREEGLFRSPVLKRTLDVDTDDACVEKELYFTETSIAPVPILVNTISLADPELNQRQGNLIAKVSRWKQISKTVVCIEQDSDPFHDINDAIFFETDAGRDLHWEAYLLRRILRAGPKQGIPKPLHLCVSAKDRTLSLRMELDRETYTHGATIFGSLEDLLKAQEHYNQGGIPEMVSAWLMVEITSLLNCAHHAGVVHNNLCMESFLLVRSHEGENWSLVLNGFGAKGSSIDGVTQCCFVRDLRGVAALMWTLLVGGMPFSCSKKGSKMDLDNKSFITSNRFLRGKLGWEDLFQTLLNPGLPSYGFHSMSDWSDLAHSLDLIKMILPSSNRQTPASVANFLDSLWSHCEGETVPLARAVSASAGDTEIVRLRQLVSALEEKCKKVEQEKIASVASIEFERTVGLQQLLERNREQETEHASAITKAQSELER